MSIENISMVINGLNVSIENASPEQLVRVIEALNKSSDVPQATKEVLVSSSVSKSAHRAQTKSEVRRKKIRNNLSNFQVEETPILIKDFFVTAERESIAFKQAVKNKFVLMSLDSGKPFSKDSKQVVARQAIIYQLFQSDNNSKTLHDFHELMSGHKKLNQPSIGAIGNYLAQCSRLGILAKTTSGKGAKYHLSAWFLEQI